MTEHNWNEAHFETRAIHAGQDPDPATGAIITPIYQTSTFVQDAVGEHKGYDYARSDNPTRTALQTALASLEGGEWALSYASGLAAAQNLFYLLRPGDHILLSNDAYGGTYRLVAKVIAHYGIDFDLVEMSDLDAVRAGMRPNTKLVWVETPTNPLSQDRRYCRGGRTSRTTAARALWSTTRSPRPICSSHWPSAPISCCIAPPNISAAIRT